MTQPGRTALGLSRAALAAACALVSLAGPSPAHAGDALPPDLFAGYSFARLGDLSRHGGNVAVSFRLLGPIAAFADASLHHGSVDSVGRDDLTLMAGPGVRLGRPGGTVVFARALAGLVRERASVSVLDVDVSETDARFGVMAGGGVDVPFASRWAVRAQADYVWNDVKDPLDTGAGKSGLRASAGVVYRFGATP